jgi:hypothetical protein
VHPWYKDKPAATLPSSTEEYGKLFRRHNLRTLLLATSIALFNQLSGGNIILIYLLDVLSNTDAGFIQSHRYTLSLFPTLQHFAAVGSFRLFAVMMLLQIAVALAWYPETKGIRIKQEPGVYPGDLSAS